MSHNETLCYTSPSLYFFFKVGALLCIWLKNYLRRHMIFRTILAQGNIFFQDFCYKKRAGIWSVKNNLGRITMFDKTKLKPFYYYYLLLIWFLKAIIVCVYKVVLGRTADCLQVRNVYIPRPGSSGWDPAGTLAPRMLVSGGLLRERNSLGPKDHERSGSGSRTYDGGGRAGHTGGAGVSSLGIAFPRKT